MSRTRPEQEMSFSSNDWIILRGWLSEELKSNLERLCSLDATPQQSDVLRGRILGIKQILEFENMAAKARLSAGKE